MTRAFGQVCSATTSTRPGAFRGAASRHRPRRDRCAGSAAPPWRLAPAAGQSLGAARAREAALLQPRPDP
jgi:hypothetical protein